METSTSNPTRGMAATKALAAVGFVVLIIVGMALAVYAARFVPQALSRIGASVGSIFERNEQGELVAVPKEDTVPFPAEPATTTPVVVSEEPAPAAPAPAHPIRYGYNTLGSGPTTYPSSPSYPAQPAPAAGPSYGRQVSYPVAPSYGGRADLVIEEVSTGYLRSSDTASFRASREVPDGERGAVRFAIANRGTNVVTEDFAFAVEIPTRTDYTYKGRVTRELAPGDRVVYTLGFDQTDDGNDKDIKIEIDSGEDVRESDERNNTRTVEVDIEG